MMAFKQDKQDQMQPLVLKNSVDQVQNLLALSKIEGGSETYKQDFFKLCQKLHLPLLIKIG